MTEKNAFRMFYVQGLEYDLSRSYFERHGVYKPVDRKVRPVPTTLPENQKSRRSFPENPLKNLREVQLFPPEFAPTQKMTRERMEGLKINESGYLWPEEEKLLRHVLCSKRGSHRVRRIRKGEV